MPATVDELLADLGEDRNGRGLRQRLAEDRRFVRIDKRNRFALPEWGYEEYSGIVNEISEEIDRAGGAVPLAAVVDKLSSLFGVSAGSVRTFAQTPRFVVEDGLVRLRRADEPVEVGEQLYEIAGCFDYGDRVVLSVPVTIETLRGSGRPLPTSTAARLGLRPDDRRVFTNHIGSVVVSWPSSMFTAQLSSLLTHATALGARKGDTLIVALGDSGTVTVDAVSATALNTQPTERLARLAGLPHGVSSSQLLHRLGRGLGLPAHRRGPADIRGALRRRGDHHLAKLLPHLGAGRTRGLQR